MAARSSALRIFLAPSKRGYRGRLARLRRPHAFKETYIAEALAQYEQPTYLEIGVREGESFRLAPAGRKIGIDPVECHTMKPLRRGEEYFVMTSDQFFAEQAPRVLQPASIHVALIDGLHEFRQVASDLLNLEPYMHPDGLVFLDDMNPRSRKRAADVPYGKVDVPGGVMWNGDVWKIAAFVARARPDLTLSTVDADQGVGVLSGFGTSGNEDLHAEIERCKALDYSELESAREQLLHLVPPSEFGQILTARRR
ncbi:MAG: class I SAM-dependent methyltransferase [Solirubrobacteraceae bacterium]